MKKAFTLAEVLITLGIVGVVASLTIPSLVAKYQKKEIETRLKKVYSTLSQAFVLSQANNDSPVDWVDLNEPLTAESIRKYFDKYWAPYLKVGAYCTSQASCKYKDSPVYWNGQPSSLSFFGGLRQSVILQDGTYMMFRSYAPTEDGESRFSLSQQIFVDINGGRKPNVYGKDIFVFSLDLSNGVIVPYGYNSTKDTIDKYCNSSTSNHFSMCAAKIMQNGWEINYFD